MARAVLLVFVRPGGGDGPDEVCVRLNSPDGRQLTEVTIHPSTLAGAADRGTRSIVAHNDIVEVPG